MNANFILQHPRRLCAAALSALLLGSVLPPASAAGQNASREAAIAAFSEAAGLTAQSTGALSGFSDAGEVDAAYSAGLAAAVEHGAVLGYEDHTLRPRNPISRLQALVILSRCLPELEEAGEAPAFSDVPAWAEEEIGKLRAAGLVEGGETLGAYDLLTDNQVETLAGRLRGWKLMNRVESLNSYDALLARHTSVQVTENDTVTLFASEELNAWEDGTEAYLRTGDTEAMLNEDGQQVSLLYMDEEDFTASKEGFSANISLDLAGQVSTGASESNGVITLETEMTDPEQVRAILDEDSREYPEGCALCYRYTFDSASMDVTSVTAAVRYPDGAKETLYEREYTYNVTYDKEAAPLSAFLTEGKTREITVTRAPGTEEEMSKTFTQRKGYLALCSNGEWVRHFYTDPECTVELEDSKADDFSALHIYITH